MQKHFQGREPITLEAALGRDARPMIHPFTLEPVLGPVDGHDLADLDPELHEALLWAQRTNPRHPAWPEFFDRYQKAEAWNQIFTKPLPTGRWADILADYRKAKAKDEELRVSRFMPRTTATRTVREPEVAQPVLTESDYRALLFRRAAANLNRSGMGGCFVGIYRNINVSGFNQRFDNVIVLSGGDISGTGASGSIYAPYGVDIDISGINNHITIYPCTYEQLARHAGLI